MLTTNEHRTLEYLKELFSITEEEPLIDVIVDKLIMIHQYPRVYRKITPPTEGNISDSNCYVRMFVFSSHLVIEIVNITQHDNQQLEHIEYKSNHFALNNNNEFVLEYAGFPRFF